MEGFWEAKILDFRIFFDVFSKHFSNNFLEAQKIKKNSPTTSNSTHFGTALRNARPPGREKERGPKPQEIGYLGRSLEKAEFGRNLEFGSGTPCTTFGGRRNASRIPPGQIKG